jgi:heat shock protein HtpX
VLKRIFLFGLVNVLVVVTLSILMDLLGIRSGLEARGIDYSALLVFCAFIGFGGALFSLAISRWVAKAVMGVQVIDPNRPGSSSELALLQRVHRLAQRAGLGTAPEVGIYDSPEINAFATGPSRNRALVAVSSGLLRQMDDSAIEGVLGHELTHVANGDMVTMTLLQGVVNTFVMFFARILAWGISQAMSGGGRDDNRRANPFVAYLLTYAFEFAFGILGMIVIAFFSRWREFRADAGGAKLAGRDKMIHALESLQRGLGAPADPRGQSLASLKISGGSGLMALLQSHPALEVRIAALRKAAP